MQATCKEMMPVPAHTHRNLGRALRVGGARNALDPSWFTTPSMPANLLAKSTEACTGSHSAGHHLPMPATLAMAINGGLSAEKRRRDLRDAVAWMSPLLARCSVSKCVLCLDREVGPSSPKRLYLPHMLLGFHNCF